MHATQLTAVGETPKQEVIAYVESERTRLRFDHHNRKQRRWSLLSALDKFDIQSVLLVNADGCTSILMTTSATVRQADQME